MPSVAAAGTPAICWCRRQWRGRQPKQRWMLARTPTRSPAASAASSAGLPASTCCTVASCRLQAQPSIRRCPCQRLGTCSSTRRLGVPMLAMLVPTMIAALKCAGRPRSTCRGRPPRRSSGPRACGPSARQRASTPWWVPVNRRSLTQSAAPNLQENFSAIALSHSVESIIR